MGEFKINKPHLVAAVADILASTPAFADEYFAVTPSGATEMMFAGPPVEVVGKLSAKCIDAHWSVTSSTTTEVVCEAPMKFDRPVKLIVTRA